MMLTDITIRNFGSFIEEQTFEFPAHHGLFYMTGRNEAEPRLGRNGSGKTTLWRAVTWVLFDKDARGLRASDIANWAAPKGAMVRLGFEHDGKQWFITRTHAPNKWVLTLPKDVMGTEGYGGDEDLTKEDNNPVYAMLRLEFNTWLNTVLMAQGEPMFLDLKAGPQAELFSDVLGLDKWVTYSKRASTLATAEDTRIRAFEIEVATLLGKIRTIAQTDHSADSRAWAKKKEERLSSVAHDYERVLGESKRLKTDLDHVATGDGSKLDKELREAQQLHDDHRTILAERTERKFKAKTDLALADLMVANAKAAVDALKAGECPMCGSEVPGVTLALMETDWRTANEKARNSFADLKEAERKQEQADEQARRSAETALQARERVQGYTRDLNAARIAWEAAERSLDKLEDEAQRIQQEENPYDAIQRSQETASRRLEVELDEVEFRLGNAAARYERLGFWVRGFKDLRLQLIAEALETLAIEVNSCITSNGLVGWELFFAVDRETKGNTISRGFTVYVKSPHNDKPVPWAAWSGGEAQRLRVSAQEGLANLIRASTGANIPLEVWDEPTDGLSDTGIQDLMETLRARAITERRQIWVIDHRALDYGNFDGEVTVVKDKRGSRFEVVT